MTVRSSSPSSSIGRSTYSLGIVIGLAPPAVRVPPGDVHEPAAVLARRDEDHEVVGLVHRVESALESDMS